MILTEQILYVITGVFIFVLIPLEIYIRFKQNKKK